MSFHRLRVFQAIEQLDEIVIPLISGLPKEFASDVDEITRALGSLRYNVGEANGSASAKRRAYHLSVGRGSVDEARAGLRRLVARGAIPLQATYKANQLASVIAKMLTAWMEWLKKNDLA